MKTKKNNPQQPRYQLAIRKEELSETALISDDARRSGIHLMAGSGHGKSRFLGRVLAFSDCYRGVPMVILDPVGETINQLLDKISRRDPDEQRQLWPRIRYVDMSGQGAYVTPFPLYYRLFPSEHLGRVARRYVETVKRFDPELQKGPIHGYNPLKEMGLHLGIVLAGLGLQITEARDLLDSPLEWAPRLRELASRNRSPAVQEAVHFFTKIYAEKWGEYRKDSHTSSFIAKLVDITLDDGNRAIFGATVAGVDWDEVVRKGLTVLIDFSQEASEDLRQFKVLWVLESFLSYVQKRGPAGRKWPISLIIDELAFFNTGTEAFTNYLDMLINRTARNNGLWLTVAHQEAYQFDEKIMKSLMAAMTTQIIGATQDPESALQLAKQFYRYKPLAEKWRDNVYGTESHGESHGWSVPGELSDYISSQTGYGSSEGHSVKIDEKLTFFTIDEQFELASHAFMDLRPFHFMAKIARFEGDRSGPIRKMTIEAVDSGIWPNREAVEENKEILQRRFGKPVQDVLKQIEARLERLLPSDDTIEYTAPEPVDTGTPAATNGHEEVDDEDPLFRKK
jgi:hypothetical protein